MSNSKIYDVVWQSMDELNEVNTEFIANKICAKEEVISEFLNNSDDFVLVPKSTQNGIEKCWLPVNHYIGGNLSKKLKETEIANSNGEFDKTIKILKDKIPASFDLLNNTPGMSILTIDYINDFITHLNGKKIELNWWEQVVYNPFSDKFYVNIKHRYSKSKLSYANINNKWGTADKSAVDLIYEILNGIPTVVYDIGHNVNQKKTELANAKRDAIHEEFRRWLICDSKRRKSVEKLIIDTIAGYKKSNISGDYLTFPELNENFKFYDYQKDAIAFALHKKNTLLAMNVGSGKTATIYGIVMKRNQIVKNHDRKASRMIVVANSTLLQFKEQIMLMHPSSNILVIEPKNFTPSKRNSVLKEIKENGANYDCILIPQSCFDSISVSLSWKLEKMYNKLISAQEKLSKTVYVDPLYDSMKSFVESYGKKVKKFELLYDSETSKPEYTEEFSFENLNIDYLYIDEAQAYKNASFNKFGSKSAKADSAYCKVKSVQEKHDGGGVVFATGTPLTNSMTEVFCLQKFLGSDSLESLDISKINAWIGLFAKVEQATEIKVDTSRFHKKMRLTNFILLKELSDIISDFTYFHISDNTFNINVKRINVTVPQTPEMMAFQDLIQQRAECCENHIYYEGYKNDNFLAICSDSRCASVDLRLFDESLRVNKSGTKAWYAAKEIADVYFKYSNVNATQLVFCDIGTPKSNRFNFYDELRQDLIELGVKSEEIAYIHQAKNDAQRKKLFDAMNSGDTRILIASTSKAGIGVNVQTHLKAIHNINPPWLPSDVTQREGRMIRNGNTNDSVFIYTYTTEKSLDSFMWQTLERKARFINSFLSSQLPEGSKLKYDLSEDTFDYAHLKAISIGNESYKHFFEVDNELKKVKLQKAQEFDEHISLENQLEEQKKSLELMNESICRLRQDNRAATERPDSSNYRNQLRTLISVAVLSNAFRKADIKLAKYRGFDIIAPKSTGDIAKDKKLLIKGTGTYIVEIESEAGSLTKIDNVIDSFTDRIEKARNSIETTYENIQSIQTQLSTFSVASYDKRIEELEKEFDALKASINM